MMKDQLKIIVVVLVLANLVLPYFVINVGFVRGMKQVKENKESLKKVQDNNVKIAAFLAGPDVVKKFANKVQERIEQLKEVMPAQVEMITTQKVFSQLAKSSGVSIVGLKPIKEGDPLKIKSKAPHNKQAGGDGESGDVETGILTALMEIKLKGSYSGIVKFLHAVERSEEIILSVESLVLESLSDGVAESEEDSGVQDVVGLNMIIKLFYAQ